MIGDLLGFPREDGLGYDTTGKYKSHTDIVVDVRVDEGEIDVIGGNVDDSVTQKNFGNRLRRSID